MTPYQRAALAGRRSIRPTSWQEGSLRLSLSVSPADTRPSGFIWMCSVSRHQVKAEAVLVLRGALAGVGDKSTDHITVAPSGVVYCFRDLTLEEAEIAKGAKPAPEGEDLETIVEAAVHSTAREDERRRKQAEKTAKKKPS